MSYVYHIKLKKTIEIILWVKDAIQVRAFFRNTDENRLGLQPKATKIQVKYKINDDLSFDF